ncbi:MAG TPA: UvrD-helicase domain-containing protein [Lacipirellulaceae bacterium]|jgi:ATP-dependent helicase/nuclease subunit A|nr:UvrD-helicase domain-containing protein [Lacipirellulaceae bacterium]
MAAATLTTEQALAIDRRDVSISLSAGAGCGKTHVLTSRFLSHLDPTLRDAATPIALHQLIAITFTDAAAREMRSRIRAACYEHLDDEQLSADDRAAWQRLLREIDAARVSTIHAFCTALLRSHASEAGLDPTFAVLEQAAAEVLFLEVLDDVLRHRLAASDNDTLDLAAEFGTLAKLKQRVSLLVDQRHRPAFDRWRTDGENDNALTQEMVSAWHTRYDLDKIRFAVEAIREKAPLAELGRLLAIATPNNGNLKFASALSTLGNIVSRLDQSPNSITEADLAAILENAKVQSICKKDDWPSDDDFAAYKKVCEKVRDVVKSGQPPPWDDTAARAAALLGLKLLRLAADVAAAYQARKDQLAALDFTDQLVLAHRLLSDPEKPEIREALSADLRLLLVDEFQDTDPLQVDLIKKLCGAGFDEGRLFFVGDFKQSIYRFRGAVPPEFLKLRDQVPDPGRLQLTTNFRSQPGVIDFVNALFHDTFAGYERLVAHRKPAGHAPCVEFLWTVPNYDDHAGESKVEVARRQEAENIARRLRELIDNESTEAPVIDRETKQPRRLRPGDVAILFRALSDVRYYEEALRDQGLDYYLVGGQAFYAQQEIFDVLNLLRAIASSADEISLAGVLRSPFFSLFDESLFWLVEHGGTLNDGLFANEPPPELASEELAKINAARRALTHLRGIKNRVPIAALLNAAFDLTGYDAVLLTEFLGERKLANLSKLVEQARVADRNGNDLNEFITQLTEFIAQPPKEPLASTSAESADVIRLMTIHRAKGLEFPFVIVPDLDRIPRLEAPDAALDDDLGPVVRLSPDESREDTATGMTLFAARERAAELEERKRLLYVACTRAADYLALSTSIEAPDVPKSDWMKFIATRFNLHSGEFIADLPQDYEPPRVHIAPPPVESKPVGRSRGSDLLKMLDEAHTLADDGAGTIPPLVAPILPDCTARRQFSFSRLTGQLVHTAENNFAITQAAPGSPGGLAPVLPLDPRSLGSLTHEVLARLDFRTAATDSQIADWCEHLAPQFVIQNTAETTSLAQTMLARFAGTARAEQLATAQTLLREIEFLLPWPPNRNSSTQYFRGYIDCLYQDAKGAWRIVDYKTNEVSATDAKRIAKRYELQLYVYALAAEQALSTQVTELVLELLRPGIEHVIPWNGQARTNAIDQLNKAVATTITAHDTESALL